MSFDTLWDYQTLMVPEYQVTMLHYLTLWAKESKFPDTHCIWGRLRGESRYCRNEFYPDAQASNKRKEHRQDGVGHRYTVIHYCGRQNTIECRVLPMISKVNKASRAVLEVINITNACLFVLGKTNKREKTSAKITLPGNMVYEEKIVEEI